MNVKTETIAGWSTQTAGRAKRDLINRARSALAKRQMYGIPAPDTMDVPGEIVERHCRRFRLSIRNLVERTP